MNKGRIYLLLLFLCSCYRVPEHLEPKINSCVQDRYLQQLPSPFPALTSAEKSQDWGKEYLIGLGFAHRLDLYQAITAFKRADILIPAENHQRKLELYYEILLCYYLGKKYEEVDQAFRLTALSNVDPSFPAYKDLLVILYDTYVQLNNDARANYILELIHQNDPEAYEKCILSTALIKADFPTIKMIDQLPPPKPYLDQMLTQYEKQKKSVNTAKLLNAVIPGAGYYYIGQKQTAVTAFLVNGLFIAAAVHFFLKNEIAAGVITTSFEAGWYFGGIYGVAHETKFYNERLYERLTTPMMHQQKLFPVFMLHYAF